jgi:hypothetical protein
MVTIPPEVAFDHYFRRLNLEQQKIYEGKYDLDQLEPGALKRETAPNFL